MEFIKINLMIIYNIKAGLNAYNHGEIDQAISHYNIALKITEHTNIKPLIGVCLYNIGLAYKVLEDYEKCISFLNKAINIWNQINFTKGVQKSIDIIKELEHIKKLEVKKDELLFPKEEIDLQLIDKKNKLSDLNQIDIKQNYRIKKEKDKEKEKIHILRTDLDDFSGKTFTAKEYEIDASKLKMNGKYVLSFNKYLIALNIYNQLNKKNYVCRVLKQMGSISRILKEYNFALECFENALKISQELQKKEDIGFIYNSIGLIYLLKKEYSKSIQYFRLAIRIFEEINYERGKYAALNNLKYVLEMR
ncbi:MAG: tetratricopeptide repeat protein [Candidatus Helarchaeota archaeon]